MHSLYIRLLTAPLAFPDMLDIPQRLVRLGSVLAVREYKSRKAMQA